MGTRHLIKVTYKGKNVIAQYGQWDGYPTGQGADICEFICTNRYYESLKDKAMRDELHFLTESEKNRLFDIFSAEKLEEKGIWSKGLENALSAAFCSSPFSRDAGAGILKMAIRSYRDFYTIDMSDFEQDTLFCEYVHHIDLDRDTYTIYRPAYRPYYEKMRKTFTVKEIMSWDSLGRIHKEMQTLEEEWKKIAKENGDE